MADKKISQLTSATTPLVGTEVLPIVQSSTTVQVSAANVTAGRAVSGASFDVTGSTAPANGMYLPAANSVALSTNSSVRFRVDASGNAGLGVTPAAHGSSERALDIGNTTSFGRQSDAALVANFNVFTNASSQYVYRISSFASSYQQLAGEHKFFTAPSGTAGNNVTLTQRMTITQPGDITANTGNFVVGTAGKGIDFSANGGDILSQYDEGTYTPVFTASSSNPTVTYGLQRGKYVRVGNSVTVSVFITWSAFSGGSGDLQISLPFAGESSVGAGGAGSISDLTGFTFAAGRTFCSIRPNSNVLYATFPQSGSLVSTSNTTVAQTAASGLIVFSTTYLI